MNYFKKLVLRPSSLPISSKLLRNRENAQVVLDSDLKRIEAIERSILSRLIKNNTKAK